MTTSSAIQKIFHQVHSASGLAFPQTAAALLALGVTRYHVDYSAGRVTTYCAAPAVAKKDEIEQFDIPSPEVVATATWSQEGVVTAIRRVQRGETKYAAFAKECVDAGVTGYLAFLTGKRVMYYGAQGDVHVEWFPGFGPQP